MSGNQFSCLYDNLNIFKLATKCIFLNFNILNYNLMKLKFYMFMEVIPHYMQKSFIREILENIILKVKLSLI